jgi:predicted metal-dependent peptidase
MPSSSPAEILDALRKARIQLTLGHAFLAAATLRLPFKEARGRDWCQTMATDGYHIFFNPAWVSTLDLPACMGVVAHEVLHVLLGHADRRGDRDPELWNIAADHAVNLLLRDQGFALPAGGLEDASFRGLTSEAIYDRLLERQRERAAAGKDDETGAAGRPSARLPDSRDLLDPNDLRAADLRDDDAPDAENRRLIRRQLLGEMRRALHGTTSGFFADEIELAREGRIDWRLLLRRFLFDRVRSDWRSYPYSKRWIHRGLYMPSVGIESPGHLVIAIDTSGSVSNRSLAQTFAEVRALRDVFPCELTVIQCDAAIQQIEHYAAEDGTSVPAIQSAQGRGGTDFRPVFDWLGNEAVTAHVALLYFTDGYGRFPQGPPPWPTIWLVENSGARDKDFPFGLVCRLT